MSSFSDQTKPTVGAQVVFDQASEKYYLLPTSVLAGNELSPDKVDSVVSALTTDTVLLSQKAVDLVMKYMGCYDDTRYKFDYTSPYPWKEAQQADFDPDGYIGIKDWNKASQMK